MPVPGRVVFRYTEAMAFPGEATPAFDRALALEACGDEALRRDVTVSFVEFLAGERGRIEAVATAGDVAELGRTAHRIKSTFHVVGAVVACATAETLEQAARAGSPEAVAIARRLLADIDGVVPELVRSLGEAPAPVA